jgi:antitoxin ParD1/3/4
LLWLYCSDRALVRSVGGGAIAYNKCKTPLTQNHANRSTPQVEAFVQRQIASGKYHSALEVILAGIQLLEQQEDIYRGRLLELQRDARVGWKASQQGQVVDSATAMAQIRANLRSRYGSSEA